VNWCFLAAELAVGPNSREQKHKNDISIEVLLCCCFEWKHVEHKFLMFVAAGEFESTKNSSCFFTCRAIRNL
jgi:hypothetical protein